MLQRHLVMLAIAGSLVAAVYYRGSLGVVGLVGAYFLVGILVRVLDSMSDVGYEGVNRTATVLGWPFRAFYMICDGLDRKRATDRYQIQGLDDPEPLTFQKQSEAVAKAHQLADASGECVLIQDTGTFAKDAFVNTWGHRFLVIEPQSSEHSAPG